MRRRLLSLLLLLTVSQLQTAARGQEAEPAADPAASTPSTPPSAAAPPDEANAEKLLRFNFRRQPWEEVLQWLADQADLSLVLDAPPPGTFNYTDARAYRTDQAIDLVNGVLASKGYTLLRRERMLMLVNLQDEIPRTLIPRVSLAEIDGRGEYEFVTVAFPLEGRSIEAAEAEIAPLLSRYGKASVLPASGQLLVTDRAGVMRVISAVIESIAKPRAAPQPPTAEKPEFRVYPLAGADAAAAVEMLEAVASGKFVHDPAGDRVNAYATPSQHAIIEQLMQQVRNTADQQRFRLEIYPLEGLSAARQAQLVSDLAMPIGNGQIRFDAENEQLIVWASTDNQLAVRKALLSLLAAGNARGANVARVYELKYADAGQLLPLLQSATPEARVNSGGAADRLLVVASLRDQQILEQLVRQLDQPPRSDQLTLKEYPFVEDPPTELVALLAAAAPNAKIRVDNARRTVFVTGDPQEQQIVGDLLAEIRDNLTPRTERPLAIYVLDTLQRERFESVRPSIEQAAPQAKLVWNEASGELFVWASTAEQKAIGGLLETLRAQPRLKPSRTLRAYALAPAQLDALAALASQVAPAATTTIDKPGRRLLVWAEPEDHQLLTGLLQQAGDTGDAVPQPQSYHSYPAGEIDLTLAVRLLQERFPAAEFEPDAIARSIVARANPSEHLQIDELLRHLRAGSAARTEREVRVYPMNGITVDQAEGMRQIFPGMRINIDGAAQQLAAWGSPEEQRQLDEALRALRGTGGASGWQIHVHRLQRAKASEVAPGLQLLMPGVNAAAINQSQLLVRCRDEMQPQVDALIKQLDINRGVDERQSAQSFPLKRADPTALLTSLQTLFPPGAGTAFSYDQQTKSLIAVADPEQLKLAETVIAAADGRDTGEDEAAVLQVHVLGGIEGAAALATLEKMFKEREANPMLSVEPTRGRIVAVATPQEQQLIEEVLTTLQPRPTELEVFPLETMDPYSAELAIGQLFDNGSTSDGSSVEIQSDTDGGRILVRGTRQQLTEIRALLVKMGEVGLLTNAPAQRATGNKDFGVYPLKNSSAERVASVLSNIYRAYGSGGRRLQITSDDRINAVVVKGSRIDRREVEALLQALDTSQVSDFFKPNQPVMVTLQHASAEQVHDQIESLYRTELSGGANRPPIEIPPGAPPEMVATLQQINAAREGPLLSIEVDRATNSLLLIAPRPLLDEIRLFVQQLDQQSTKSRVGIRVVPLDELQGDEVLKSLERILNEQRR
jgi:type II secretory pathway component GspD/PulD (secretin)